MHTKIDAALRLSAMLGGGFNDMLPLASANFSIYLAMDFLHEVVFVALVMKEIASAGFASKNRFSVWVVKASDFRVHEHGVAVRAERPSVCGVPGYV
ncbi:MAG: hypothetical protein ACXWF8_03110 [Methylobacter sp.]